MKIAPFSVLMIVCMTIPQSCSTTSATKITGTWKDPEAGNYKDFLVAVLSKNLNARTALEENISKKLKRKGAMATRSLEIFQHSEKLETQEEKKAAVEKIQGLGHDAIITVVLISKTEEERYVPGTTSYAPTNIGVGTGYYNPVRGTSQPVGQYDGFGGYYVNASTTYSSPGYYETDKTYYVESRVFDLKTSKLIWSAQSETFNPGNIGSAADDFSVVMVEAMGKAGLIFRK